MRKQRKFAPEFKARVALETVAREWTTQSRAGQRAGFTPWFPSPPRPTVYGQVIAFQDEIRLPERHRRRGEGTNPC